MQLIDGVFQHHKPEATHKISSRPPAGSVCLRSHQHSHDRKLIDQSTYDHEHNSSTFIY